MRISSASRSCWFTPRGLIASGRYALVGVLLAVQAWAGQPAWAQSMPIPETLGVRLGIINYLGEGLDPVYINQGWAGNARPRSHSSGTCCVAIPTQWQPGMTMRIEWRTDSMFKRGETQLMVRDAPVLPYEPFHDGYAWAVFLPGGEIFVQPSDYGPGGPGFLQGLPQPADATEADLKRFLDKHPPPPAMAPSR